MRNTYPIGTPLTFVWRFQASDGTPIAFTSRYSFVLKYITGRGTDLVDTFFVNADGDGISWTFPADEQHFVGNYGLALDIFYDGDLLEHCYYRDAFSLYKSANGSMNLTQNERSKVVDLLTIGEFYHFMTGEVINFPDEEDITSGTNNLLKFKDRTPESGMGYVILRSNRPFADQLTQENTIYEIRYEFDFDGGSVTVPTNCILKFNGGKLNNGTLIGQNTRIKYDGTIFENIIISGTWNIPVIKSSMFANCEELDGLKNVISLQNDEVYNEIIIEKSNSNYSVGLGSDVDNYIIGSNVKLVIDGNIEIISNSSESYRILSLYGKNISIIGSGKIIGDRQTHTYSGTGTHEQGHGIFIGAGSSDITINGIEVYDCIGDGISQRSFCSNIVIQNVHIHHCRRQGITVQSVENIIIENFNIHDIYGVDPSSGIDLEPNATDSSLTCEDIIIRNGKIKDCKYGICNSGEVSQTRVYRNIDINNLVISGCGQGVALEYAENVSISNCTIYGVGYGITSRCDMIVSDCIIQTSDSYQLQLGLFSDGNYHPILRRCKIYSVYALYTPNGVVMQGCYVRGSGSLSCVVGSAEKDPLVIKDSIISCSDLTIAARSKIYSSSITCGIVSLGPECVLKDNDITSSRETSATSFIGYRDNNSVGRYVIVNNHINVADGVFRYIILLAADTKSVVYGNIVSGHNTDGRFVGPATGNYIKDFCGFAAFGGTRPTFDTDRINDDTPIGICFLDTLLGKPVWWTGSTWVDATGTAV